MLTRLALRNFVIAESVELTFAEGFCALTGETGAGKSLLVGALALLGGARASAAMVRAPATRAEVQAAFDIRNNPAAQSYVQENDLANDDADEPLLVRRVIGSGKAAAYINGRQVPLAQLTQLMALLIEICGQHAHYSLRHTSAHRDLLDSSANADTAAVAAAHRDWRSADAAHAQAAADAQHAAQQRAMLTEELAELSALGFSAGKWQEQNAALTRHANIDDLAQGCARTLALLRGEEEGSGSNSASGIQAQLAQVRRQMETMAQHAPHLAEHLPLLADADALCDEVARAVRQLAETLHADPQALAEAESFVATCHRLARKYALPDAAQLGDLIEQKHHALANLPDAAAVEELAQTARAARDTLETLCAQLSAQRRRAAQALCKKVNALLPQLAMAKATLSVHFTPQPPTAHGSEKVALQIVTRRGAAAADLGSVASGGELSRLGLAIQISASQGRAAAVSVFDEVDAGIGGAAAGVVGALMRKLGAQRQVLCVTHLPQVAAQAHHHWCVRSEETLSVQQLDMQQRVEEIARMHSGTTVTAAARRHAEELLNSSAASGGG